MAGGMNRRGADRPSLHERIHGVPPEPAPTLTSAQTAPTGSSDRPLSLRHCWVNDENGRLPALLIQWHQTMSGWQGRVVRPVLEEGHWFVVEEWLPARQLEAARD
jgi:hypothetical protein